jgi:signal peptide peptidase SppA
MRYERVTKFVSEHPWSILPDRLEAILEVLRLRIEGRVFTDEEIQARIGAGPPAVPRKLIGAVAVLPVFGILAHRMNLMTQVSGGTSTEQIAGAFRQSLNDPGVTAIVLDVDSPGGSVFGIQELAAEIFEARGAKPIVAVANATAASAAYWIASQADEVVVTPSGMVGSIGVIAVHMDRSKQAEMLGVKPTFVTAGKFKGEGNELEPLDDATRASMQRKVDQYYDAFVRAVARGRGVTPAAVRDGFGEGRLVTARDGRTQGMVDSLGTLDLVVDRLASGRKRIGPIAEAPALVETPPATPPAVAPTPDDDPAEMRRQLAARGA